MLDINSFPSKNILNLTGTTYDKSKVKISQNFVAFSEYMNFKIFFEGKLLISSIKWFGFYNHEILSTS